MVWGGVGGGSYREGTCVGGGWGGRVGASWLATTLLAAILGPFGVHRFYTGYTIIGILQLLTLGGCGIWLLIDYIMLLANKYKDKDGLPLDKYNGITAFVLLVLSIIGAVIILGSE